MDLGEEAGWVAPLEFVQELAGGALLKADVGAGVGV